jgi:hypothetical protein
MVIPQSELDALKCCYKSKIEKESLMGMIEVNPFNDVDCKTCQTYYSAILCEHYINYKHIEEFQRIMRTT